MRLAPSELHLDCLEQNVSKLQNDSQAIQRFWNDGLDQMQDLGTLHPC